MLTLLKVALQSLRLRFSRTSAVMPVATSIFSNPGTTYTVTADAFIDNANPYGFCLKGNFLLVCARSPAKISVIDISDPAAISEVASFTHADITAPNDIFLKADDDDIAFVLDGDAVISLDVSDVLNIAHLDTLTADASFGDPGEAFSRLLETVTADALIHAIQTDTVTADALIKATQSKAVTADALIRIIQSAYVTSDAHIKAIQTKSVYADAYLKAIQSKQVYADAFIDALRKTITADVFIDAIRKTLTADAYIDPLETFIPAIMPVSYWTSYSRALYARMPVVEVDDGATTSHTISAIMSIISRLTKPVTADAFIKRIVSKAVTSDAFIDALRKTVTADAFIATAVATLTKTITSDAFISALTKSVTSDAFITALTKVVTADAFIKLVQQKLITSDAIIKAIQTKTVTADGFIKSLGRIISNVHLYAMMMMRRR